MTSSASPKKVALVTGANRGLGLEACRQLGKKGYHVLLGSRDEARGAAAADQLAKQGIAVGLLTLDVSQDESVLEAANRVRRELGRLDALVNNAGVFLDGREGGPDTFSMPLDVVRRTLETNLYGALRMCQRFAPLMIQTSGQPGALCRIVNVSSGLGQLSEMGGGYPAYRISKTALNAVTRIFADELGSHRIAVNSVCPGWVKTDMGGPGAELPVEQGADTIVWAATLPADGPTGGFFRERKQIDW